jgi:predicted dienelactone hydrolase
MQRAHAVGIAHLMALALCACQPNPSALPDATVDREADGIAPPLDGGAASIDGGLAAPIPPGGGPAEPVDGEGVRPDAGSAADERMDPAVAGPYAVVRDAQTLEVGPPSSRERVELTVFVPDGADVAPLVLFHPGFRVASDNYFSYGEHLASQGICVIFVDPPDALFGGPTHAQMATYLGDVLDWVETENGGGRFGTAIDLTKVGLAGHSMGGKLSLLFASQDARPIAVAGIDPVDAAGGPFREPDDDYPSVTPERMAQVSVPLLLIGETVNGTCSGNFCQPCAPTEDNFQQYFEHATSPALEIDVFGANHMSFLDNPDCGFVCSVCPAGSDDPTETRQLTQKYLSAFFQLHLFGRTPAREWLLGENMDLDVQANRVQVRAKNGF